MLASTLSKNKTKRLNYPYYERRVSGDGGNEALPSVHAIRYTISTFNDSHNGNNCTSSHKDNNVTGRIIHALPTELPDALLIEILSTHHKHDFVPSAMVYSHTQDKAPAN